MLMVIIIVAILSAVAIPQFINFQKDAKNAATSAALGALRSAIQIQYAQTAARCAPTTLAYPDADAIDANDITGGATPDCTVGEVATAAERKFIAGGIPVNPWGTTPANSVTACTNCDPSVFSTVVTTSCDGVAYTGGWCYNVTNGAIWADSANNGGTVGGTLEPNL